MERVEEIDGKLQVGICESQLWLILTLNLNFFNAKLKKIKFKILSQTVGETVEEIAMGSKKICCKQICDLNQSKLSAVNSPKLWLLFTIFPKQTYRVNSIHRISSSYSWDSVHKLNQPIQIWRSTLSTLSTLTIKVKGRPFIDFELHFEFSISKIAYLRDGSESVFWIIWDPNFGFYFKFNFLRSNFLNVQTLWISES